MTTTVAVCELCKEDLSNELNERANKQTKICCGRLHNKCLHDYFLLFKEAKCPTCSGLLRESMLNDFSSKRTLDHPMITTFPVEWYRTEFGLRGVTKKQKNGWLYIGPYPRFKCDYGHGVYTYETKLDTCFVDCRIDEHNEEDVKQYVMALWLVGGDVFKGTTYPIAVSEYGWSYDGTLVKL